MKVVITNLKHLPILATLYKTGVIFEGIFRSAGNKNAEGIFKGFNSLLVLAVISFLKTSKISIKLMSDLMSMFGLNFLNQAKLDIVFQKLMQKVSGKKRDANMLKKNGRH